MSIMLRRSSDAAATTCCWSGCGEGIDATTCSCDSYYDDAATVASVVQQRFSFDEETYHKLSRFGFAALSELPSGTHRVLVVGGDVGAGAFKRPQYRNIIGIPPAPRACD